jgi:hypothetical protein
VDRKERDMARENETKRVFGDNPISRMNTFEKLTALKQSGRRPETSRILTTPESIVRQHREVVRLNGINYPKILGRQAEETRTWFERINWTYLFGVVSIACSAAVVAVGIYVVVWHIIPFVETLRWG